MTMRVGIVVETHPEDHSVDLVMADDGSRLVGVQVLSPNASTRSGSVDMPAVPEKKDKWDITRQSGQDMKALVAFAGRTPVVTGFLFPQISQMTLNDPKTRLFRHQSDVMSVIDGDGNIDIRHPSGFAIRIGETPDPVDPAGMNADGNLALDRNTGRKPYLRVTMADGKAVLTITPDGAVSLTCEQTIDIEAQGAITVKTQSTADVEAQGAVTVTTPATVELDTPTTHCTGNLVVDGSLTFAGGMTGTGGGTTAVINGDVQINGNQNTSGNGTFGGTVTDGDGDGGA